MPSINRKLWVSPLPFTQDQMTTSFIWGLSKAFTWFFTSCLMEAFQLRLLITICLPCQDNPSWILFSWCEIYIYIWNQLSHFLQTPSSNNTREDSTHGHHQMVNIEIRLIIFYAAKDGEALYSEQKQDQELTVAQIMNSLLPNSDLNWRK